MIRRFRLFAENLLQQASRYRLSGELIIVEWNPPSGPRLRDVLDLSIPSNEFTVRFIEVPQAAHQALRNSDVIPLFQMIAKNVGIRRARSDFVLATNPDLLFSDALISFLASQQLRRDTMYRIDRHDVPAEPPRNASVDALFDWCESNVLRVHRKWGSFPPVSRWKLFVRRLSTYAWMEMLPQVRRRLFSALRHITLGKEILQDLRQKGLWRGIRRGCILISNMIMRWTESDHIVQGVADFLRRSAYWVADFLRRSAYWPLYLTRVALNLGIKFLDPVPKIHTNGCGDFTLLSRKTWHDLRGYPELPLWSMHLDSLLCYMAVASGMRELILKPPQKVFHLEHENSWVVMNADSRLRTFADKPWLDVGLLTEIWNSMYLTGQPVQFNQDNWGLADWSLVEVLLTHGEKPITINGASNLAATGS
jgi:hypothetical protein